MKTDPDIPRIVRSWLRTDEHEDASRVLDNVLGLLDSTPQRRAWWPARRLPHVNTPIRIAVAIAAVVVVASSSSTSCPRTAAVGGPPATAVPTVSPSAQPSASLQATHMTVAGTGVNGPALGLTVQLPQGWGANEFVADRGTSSAPSGMAFVVSEVDNTFAILRTHPAQPEGRIDSRRPGDSARRDPQHDRDSPGPDDDRRAPGDVHRNRGPRIVAVRPQ